MVLKIFFFLAGFIPIYSFANSQTILPERVDERYVYHSSPISGLSKLSPHVSTHNMKWVYAAENPAIALSFLSEAGDFTFGKGSCDGGVFHIVERYPNALEAYRNTKGSLYRLDRKYFKSGQTNWNEKVVSTHVVPVKEEWVIDDALSIIKKLALKNLIKIYYYPSRPRCIPKNDSDILEKAIRWEQEGREVRKNFFTLHPKLKNQFLEKINNLSVSR